MAEVQITEEEMRERLNVASELTDELKAEYYRVFYIFDSELNGSITPTNAAKAVRILGYNPTDTELKNAISRRVGDDPDAVPFVAFMDIMLENMRTTQPPNELKYAFDTLDVDHQGRLDVSYLQQVLMEHGETLTQPEVEQFVESLNVDIEGTVNFEDVKRLFDTK